MALVNMTTSRNYETDCWTDWNSSSVHAAFATTPMRAMEGILHKILLPTS